ncbi:MAG: ComEC/Rec2 family competence protein [Acutalibacteraceae bacterium]
MSRPFALIGFVYLAVQAVSIYFGSGFAFLASGCFFLLFFLSLFVTKLRTSKVVPIACLVTAVALSAYAGYHVWKIEPLAELAEKDASITGTLCELPYENNGKFYYTLRIDEIEIEGMEHPHNPGKIIMTTRNALDIEPYGSISGKVHLYQSFGSEDGFSVRQYDYSKRIHMRAYLYEYEGYSVSPTAEKPPYYYALSIRKTMMNSLDRLLPKEEAGIMRAVLLGDKTGLTDEIKSDFNAAGTYHLLVVSGLHMTIVFQGLLKLLKFCKIPHKLSCVITAFGVLSFMAITGFSPSVLRSGIMSLLFLAAMIFHRKADSLNSLGIAVFLLCVINPYAAADFGFLLSVTSALSLILLSKPIRKFFLDRTKRVKYGKAFLYSIFSSVSSSLAVTAGTLPLVIIAFVTFSVISFISNLLMIFPTTIMLPITALAALFESVPSLSLLAKPFALVGGLIAKYLIFVAHWIAKIPFSLISSDYEFIMLWLAMTMLLFAFAIFLAKRKILIRTVLTLSSILLIAGIFSYQLSNHSTARVSILDVDDGISVVVTANHQTAIIGCNAYSDYTAYQYLKGHIHHIDYCSRCPTKQRISNLAKLNNSFKQKI